MRRDVYSGFLRLNGEEDEGTLREASNYASSLFSLGRFEAAKALLRKTRPVARRALGEKNKLTLKMRAVYAAALYEDSGATLDDLREAVETSEEIERTARRVFGGAHPTAKEMENVLKRARAALRAREAGKRLVFVEPT